MVLIDKKLGPLVSKLLLFWFHQYWSGYEYYYPNEAEVITLI